MSWLKGYKRTKRRGHRNFTHEPANKRMKEALEPHRASIRNALSVNSVPVMIFKAIESGVPCSCRKTIGSEIVSKSQEVQPSSFSRTIDDTDLFGETSYQESSGFDVLEAGDMLAGADVGDHEYDEDYDDEGEEMIDRPLQSSVKCGICYRLGFSPAFESVGYSYQVLTSYNIEELEGFEVSQSDVPTRLVKVDEDGKVWFDVVVPMYFNTCTVSIRDNDEILTDLPKYDVDNGVRELSKQFVHSMRGGIMRIFVDVPEFTHVVFTFDLGVSPIMANLSEEANSLDFMTMNTIGNMTVALPHNVGYIKPRDVIYIPDRNLTLKVTDAPKKQLVNQEIMEWLVTTRVLQPQEELTHIAEGRELF